MIRNQRCHFTSKWICLNTSKSHATFNGMSKMYSWLFKGNIWLEWRNKSNKIVCNGECQYGRIRRYFPRREKFPTQYHTTGISQIHIFMIFKIPYRNFLIDMKLLIVKNILISSVVDSARYVNWYVYTP